MDFNREWTVFAVEAEIEHFGVSRLVKAHNDALALRACAEGEAVAEITEEDGLKWLSNGPFPVGQKFYARPAPSPCAEGEPAWRCVTCGFEDSKPLRNGVNNHWRKGYVPGLHPTSREAICYDKLKPIARPAPSGWIPVSERLPEESVDVLVYSEEVGQATVACRAFQTGEWINMAEQFNFSQEDITHWQPLPAAPVAGEGKEGK